jgi:hypothetical protein
MGDFLKIAEVLTDAKSLDLYIYLYNRETGWCYVFSFINNRGCQKLEANIVSTLFIHGGGTLLLGAGIAFYYFTLY